MKKILITGAAGFVGHHTVEHILKNTDWQIVALVRLNTIGDINRLMDIEVIRNDSSNGRILFIYHDLNFAINPDVAKRIGHVDYIVHMAANSHVDRSIKEPLDFFYDNVIGTVNLLEFARNYNPQAKFINFGTDEVFGPAPDDYNFKEDDTYKPSNPYSASKAGQLDAGIAYFVTFKLPIITTHAMNIFGERQNSEKFIPMCMKNILAGKPQIIHAQLDEKGNVKGVGSRFWLHARNAADAVLFLLEKGVPGEKYNIVGDIELKNDELCKKIGGILGKEPVLQYIDFHKTRPGHDRRYSLDGSKLNKLGWKPPVNFEDSLRKTIEWTLKRWMEDNNLLDSRDKHE
ncbi:MAG: GDP-mannose 4,6-dehydratase [Candidatus Woesearchaeota archaeon]|nr:MAG: GDP-mannose 4,6-dehydratase [Candidatus Woesearchaeota archaeon]